MPWDCYVTQFYLPILLHVELMMSVKAWSCALQNHFPRAGSIHHMHQDVHTCMSAGALYVCFAFQ